MTDSSSSPENFKLPQDIETLSLLRDQLGDYLSTLERNTDAVNEWLAKNEDAILISHHALARAIRQKDQAAFDKAMKEAGDDVAGFILGFEGFKASFEKSFGKGAFDAFEKKAFSGVPKKLLEDLPEIKIPEPEEVVAAPAIELPPEPVAEPVVEEKKKGFWKKLFGGGDDAEEAEKEEDPAVVQQRAEEEMKKRWRAMRAELISLQSDNHYYIDSFMKWVVDGMEPETAGAHSPAMMDEYQNPDYVIKCAQVDYDNALITKTQNLQEKAIAYSGLAAILDEQDIPELIGFMPTIFKQEKTKQLLLKSFNVDSFAELALNHYDHDREKQLNLLSEAIRLEGMPKLNGLTQEGVFELVLSKTLDKTPLSADAIPLIFAAKGSKLGSSMALSPSSEGTAIKRIVDRYKNDFSSMEKVLGALMGPIGGDIDAVSNLVQFKKALSQKDAGAICYAINSIEEDARKTPSGAVNFMALWALSSPGVSILKSVCDATPAQDLSYAVEKGLNAGIFDELQLYTTAKNASAPAASDMIGNRILGNLDTFAVDTARKVIATVYANGGLDNLRDNLERDNGILQLIAQSDIADSKKVEWIAAFLEPFPSEIVKANILHKAVEQIGNNAARGFLNTVEENLIGTNIRINDDLLLTNLGNIANVWYYPDTKSLKFTVSGGASHIMAADISQETADEIMSVIKRRGDFISEYGGIFNPKNIDRIGTAEGVTTMAWAPYASPGPLNVDDRTAMELHSREDYLHVSNGRGRIFSINIDSIVLLEKQRDGSYMMIDKYGEALSLDGEINFKPSKDMIETGNGSYFNPKNASMMFFQPEDKQMGFRIESKHFDTFLNGIDPQQSFYTIPMSAAAIKEALDKKISKDNNIATPEGAELENLYFNMPALGYILYGHDKAQGDGLYCQRHSNVKKRGFISATPELVRDIFNGMDDNPSIIRVGNLITHKDCIDDIYYDIEKRTLLMLIRHELVPAPCDPQTAARILDNLNVKGSGFAMLTSDTSGVLPDIVNVKNATVYQYKNNETFITGAKERFRVLLKKDAAHDLFDAYEAEGLKAARKASSATPAVQTLAETLAAARPLQILMTPSLTSLNEETLLSQVTGQAKKEKTAQPDVHAQFSIAARKINTGDILNYPVEQRRVAQVRPRSPGLRL
jgi:hypothetical protein